MVRPTWVTVIGVLGIIFGCSAILGGGQQIAMPKMLAMQKEMFADMSADIARQRAESHCSDASTPATRSDEASSSASSSRSSAGSGTSGAEQSAADNGTFVVNKAPCAAVPPPVDAMLGMFQDIWTFPPWFATWLQISGGLRVLIGGLYLFGAIWFIQMKPSALWLFSTALVLSILLGVAQFVAAAFAAGLMVFVLAAGSSVGIIIDIVMLLVIWLSDRTIFRARPGVSLETPAAF